MLVTAIVGPAAPALASKALSDASDTRGGFDISSVQGNRGTGGGPPGHRSHYYMFSGWTFDPITCAKANRGSIRVFVDTGGSTAPDLVIRPVGRWAHHRARAVLVESQTHTRASLSDAWLWEGAFHVMVPTSLLEGRRTPRYYFVMSNGKPDGTDRAPNVGWRRT